MKNNGLVLALVLAIGGLLRLTGSSLPALATNATKTAPKISTMMNSGTQVFKGTYPDSLAAEIQQSFGDFEPHGSSAAGAELREHYDVPATARNSIKFVVAILPDPVHTHLGLFFDRSVEALQQAAQREGYAFDRAILPWDPVPSGEAQDPKVRDAQEKAQQERESYPGLLIFRAGDDYQNAPPSQSNEKNGKALKDAGGDLFVFVVGESPTAGLRRQQFLNAVTIIDQIRALDDKKIQPTQRVPLLIMGPSFSGSLESLHEELSAPALAHRDAYVYSGTVTGESSMNAFEGQDGPNQHFASFQESDAYSLAEFVAFAKSRGYKSSDTAVLSEDETVYGAAPNSASQPSGDDVIRLHFPREIANFRAAYQKEVATQQPAAKTSGTLTLPLDLGETGSDDDKVAAYGGSQTPLSQEAVMLGIVSELHKHRIKFTVLLATDPVDQLFLAQYLRTAYPQGRVVVTAPDLLLAREDDPALHGVLGLSSYSLVPGFDNLIGHVNPASQQLSEDPLFPSSLNVGVYNAMLGLLEVEDSPEGKATSQKSIPPAPYAEYGRPPVEDAAGRFVGDHTAPFLWLTILGRDGFWPILGLNGQGLYRNDGILPVMSFPADGERSTLEEALGPAIYPTEKQNRTPVAWRLCYCICLLLMFIHAWFSLTGTILSNSESVAQFAITEDWRRSLILAIGGWLLVSAFTLIMCTRDPVLNWRGGTLLSAAMWLPLAAFTGLLIWDFAVHRGATRIAVVFGLAGFASVVSQILLVWAPFAWLREHTVCWSTRVLELGSGVSPVLPVFLLICAGYWWVWFAMRGVALVDLRRPRLPEPQDLPAESFRMSDREAEKLRMTAHPLHFSGIVLGPILALGAVSMAFLDLRPPLQTLEGSLYDWGCTILLGVLLAMFVGCLIKLVCSWLECQQILAGLDRLPLREAFGRMTGLSWKSLWTPGGSTLRETYKVLSRAFESMQRLQRVFTQADFGLTQEARSKATAAIEKAVLARERVLEIYAETMQQLEPAHNMGGGGEKRTCAVGHNLDVLANSIEEFQKRLAAAAGVVIKHVLQPWWAEEESAVVSKDAAMPPRSLPSARLLAEEFSALIYVNLLTSVLLRMRTMVICAAGVYVFIICAMSAYPFEPRPALQTMFLVMLLFMAALVGYVYAGMHRDAILSRLTSTNAGELGFDFWVKFISAGAIPVVSLLAVQFPEVSQIFTSWFQPALQALK